MPNSKLQELQLNQSLRGSVIEILSEDELLMSFNGALVRVHNETRRPMKVGQVISVIVKAIEPVRLQLLEDRRSQRRRGHIDVSV